MKDQQPNVKRMNLNVERGLHDAFKTATASRGANMTDVLIEFIQEYVEKHYPKSLAKKRRPRGAVQSSD